MRYDAMRDIRRHLSGAIRNGRSASRKARRNARTVGQGRTPHRDLLDFAAINAVARALAANLLFAPERRRA